MIIALVIGGLIAGILNGIVGMAILTMYPLLLALGISPVMANVTANISIIFCGLSAAYSAAPNVKHYKKPTLIITILSVIGSVVGMFLLIKSSNGEFKKIVPFIMGLAGIMILLPKHPSKPRKSVNPVARLFQRILVILLGLYNGYFGAGSGILATALLSRITHKSYNVYNAVRLISFTAGDLIAAIVFAIVMPVDWLAIAILAVSLIIGGYLGPVIAKHIPTNVMETCIGIFALGLSVFLFIQAY